MKLQRSEPQSKHIENWHGREATQSTGLIKDLRKKIPHFTCEPFRIKQGVNEYKSLIIRHPLSEVGADLGYAGADLGYDEAKTSEHIPIEAVDTKGYKLVEHHDILEMVLATLDKYALDSGITDIESPKAESLEATLLLSIYGARMFIEFCAHHYKRDPYTLKVSCRNSVDKSMALTINLSLHHGEDNTDIPFDSFHHNHTKDLSNDAIKGFLSIALEKFLDGSWDTDNASRNDIDELISKHLTPEEQKQVQKELNDEKQESVNLLQFREILASLTYEGIEQFHEIPRVLGKFAELINEIKKLADDTEGTKK